MLCLINKNQTWEHWAKKLEGIKCFQSSLEFIDTSKQKGCAGWRCRSRSLNCTIVSFLWGFLRKISPFPERMNPNIFITLSAVLRGPRSENFICLFNIRSLQIKAHSHRFKINYLKRGALNRCDESFDLFVLRHSWTKQILTKRIVDRQNWKWWL